MKLTHIIPTLLFFLISSNYLYAQSITNLTLVNADTDSDITNLQNGSVVNFTTLSTTHFNIRANTTPTTIGSVVFYLDGTIVRTENVAVYAMYGNSGNNYYNWTPPLGTHEIKAIPYSGSGGSGTAGTAIIINVTFTNSSAPSLPLAPSNLQANNNTAGIANLTWADNSNNETGFEIQWSSTLHNPTWQTLSTTAANINSFTDNSLGTQSSRYYRVRATNSGGFSNYTSILTVNNKPFAPTNFRADNITNTSIQLLWDAAPFGNDYTIEYTDNLSTGFQYLDALYYGFTDFTYNGFTPNTTYYFRIRSSSFSQSSDWSSTLVVITSGSATTTAIVNDLVLVNADTDTDLMILQDGATIDLSTLPTTNLNVRAAPNPAVRKVIFFLNNAGIITENVAPYAMFGDVAGDYNNWTPTLGLNKIQAKAYNTNNVGGPILTANVTFTNTSNPPNPGLGVSGELKKWHKVTVAFQGPNTNETAGVNPFLDYRLDVTFTNGSKTYVVPGYYAADGNAAESSANSGNTWMVHFSPDEIGTWTYTASFRQGTGVAVASNPLSGTATSFDGQTGSFVISNTDKTGRDFRGKGRLQYVGEHYLQFAETGEYFIKAGADAAENTLAYEDFDEVSNRFGYRKSWTNHQVDYNAVDAQDYTWQSGKGSELLGAINYLSNQGMNVFSFLTFSFGGDDQNVFPHLLQTSLSNYEALAPLSGESRKATATRYWASNAVHKTRFDVSRLAQWEQIFEYADKKGMYLHFKSMETENDHVMDNASLGTERKLYYRELIARFGHHLALNWNITEEVTLSASVLKDIASYIKTTDPYNHHIVLHTYPNAYAIYGNLTGSQSELTGASMQINPSAAHNEILNWVNNSKSANKKWVVACDEQGDAVTGVTVDAAYSNSNLPSANNRADNRGLIRNEVLWGTLLAGGAGVEYYYGALTGCSDTRCQDHRTRATKWADAKIALDFFNTYLQAHLTSMLSADALTSVSNDYVFSKTGERFVIYLPNGGSTNLNLSGLTGVFDVKWYDPRNGGALQTGSITSLTGGSNPSIGQAPNNTTQDWVVYVTKASSSNNRLTTNTSHLSSLNEDANIRIYPNPTQRYLTIELNEKPSSSITLNILNINGSIIKTVGSNKKTTQLDLSTLNTGLYILQINDGQSISNKKIVLQTLLR